MMHRGAERLAGEVPDAEVLAAVQTALERKPEVAPPADFAHRVALQASALPQRRKREAIAYGRIAALVVSVVVAAALFLLAPRTEATFRSLGFDVEMLALLQLGLLAWWLGRQRNQSY